MDIRLVVTNIGFLFGILLNLALAYWILSRGPKRTLSVTFVCINIALAVFQIGHVLGINTYDSLLSRRYFTLSLVILFVPPLSTHWVFGVLDELKKRWREVAILYAVAVSLLILFLTYPEAYLGLSIPKLDYLPNYYDAGAFFWMVPLFYACSGIHFFIHLIRAFRTANPVLRNRLKYFMATLLFGYGIGSIAFFLAFDIPVDPIWSMFLSLYTLPLAYGILRYELMDIAVVAKRALVYGVLVAIVSLLITAVSYVNILLSQRQPAFPLWLIPLVSSFFAVAIGALVWLRLKEVDIMKYEFITIITHKFRTPLTRIKWSSEELKSEPLSDSGKYSLAHIADAGMKLNELTDALVNVAETERTDYDYKFAAVDLRSVVADPISQVRAKYAEKKIDLKEESSLEPLIVQADTKRLSFVIEVFLDNALSYTPEGGKVQVVSRREGDRAMFSVHDSGIGISRDELSMVFMKFFRNAKAKSADTEGLGIGLYLSKKVVDKHNGHISVESEGEGKGATFTLSLPLIA
jgi:signal transduction histidine kinase